MDKPRRSAEQELFDAVTKAVQELQDAEAHPVRWSSTHCPICKSELGLPALPEAVKAEQFMFFPKMEVQLGYCLVCGLSPREVKEEEIPLWVWVKIPGAVELSGTIGNHILRAQGSTLREVVEDLTGGIQISRSAFIWKILTRVHTSASRSTTRRLSDWRS